MRAGLIVVLLLLAVAVAAQFLAEAPGYALIQFQGWVVEMTIPILFALLALLLVAASLIRRVRQAPARVAERLAKARNRHAGKRVARALAALGAGRVARAEQLLAKSAKRSAAPVLQYLATARLAHASGDLQRRDRWFALARKAQPEARDALFLEQAELHLRSGEQAPAARLLGNILERRPRHLQALRLAIPLHLRRGDFAEAARRLKALRKHGDAAAGDAARWTVEAYAGLLDASGDARGAQRLWSEVPKALRCEERLTVAHARALIRHGAHDLAEQHLRRQLNASWSTRAAAAYGEVQPRDIPAAIRHAEGWLADHPDDASLLLALGRLCRKAKLWGKARSYLESALAVEASAGGWLELAELLEELDEKQAADEAFRKGLRLGGCART